MLCKNNKVIFKNEFLSVRITLASLGIHYIKLTLTVLFDVDVSEKTIACPMAISLYYLSTSHKKILFEYELIK